MNELSRAWRFIYDAITSDSQLMTMTGGRIYRGAAPQGTSFPAVIYAMISPGDALVSLGGIRLWADPTFKIVAVGETTNGLLLEPIADRLDTVLHNASGATDENGFVYTCQYLRPFELTERTANTEYQQLGGEYGLTVRST